MALHDRAMDNLRDIRETMERSAAFTHIPGAGGVGMGVIALVAGVLGGSDTTTTSWLTAWLVAAALSIVLASWAMTRNRFLIATWTRTYATTCASASNRPQWLPDPAAPARRSGAADR